MGLGILITRSALRGIQGLIGGVTLRLMLLASNVLEILKSDHNCGDVVKSALEGGVLQDTVDGLPTLLVEGSRICLVFHACREVRGVPATPEGFLVIQLLIHTITGKEDEVIVIPNFEALNLWGRNDNFGISSIFGVFGFDISDSARN